MMLLLPAVASGTPTLDIIHNCGALDLLKALPDDSIDCIVTSPPYFGLRSYLKDDDPNKPIEIGLEDTPAQFIERLMTLFREVHRVLKPTGTVWVNLGDSYSGAGRNGGINSINGSVTRKTVMQSGSIPCGRLPPKSLMMIPARFAIAMQDEGWILRSDIIWHKPSAMPESVTDRPTKAHEYVYLFAKDTRYWYDADAVKERAVYGENHPTFLGGTERLLKANLNGGGYVPSDRGMTRIKTEYRNLRTVWTINPEPFSDAHFATYPTKLVETCIKAGCPPGGVVLDMFMGSGTTALTARRLGRHFIGCDLNADYVAMSRKRLAQSDPYMHRQVGDMKQLSMFAQVAQP